MADVTKLLSLQETADTLGVSLRWLHYAIARGELPTVNLGKRRLVHPDDLETFVHARREWQGRR